MAAVRIGFIGVGRMGQCAHLRSYYGLPDCEVVAVAELQPQLGRRVAQRYGIPAVYASHRELLAKEQVDALVVSQLFTRHGSLLPELAAAGLPLFTEKPLAGSVEQAERVLAAVEAGGSWQMVGYHKRSDPATMLAVTEIRRLQASGELGALRYVRVTMPPGDWVAGGFGDYVSSDDPLPDLPADPPPSDMDAALYKDYLRLVNYYIHQINLLRHLLGEPYRVAHADPSGVLLVAESAGGVAGVLEMAPYQTTLGWDESALVCFERGYVKLDLPAPLVRNLPGRVEFYRDPGQAARPERVVPALPAIDAMRQQAANFVAAVRGEQPPPCQAAEALEDLRIAREYLRLWRGA